MIYDYILTFIFGFGLLFISIVLVYVVSLIEEYFRPPPIKYSNQDIDDNYGRGWSWLIEAEHKERISPKYDTKCMTFGCSQKITISVISLPSWGIYTHPLMCPKCLIYAYMIRDRDKRDFYEICYEMVNVEQNDHEFTNKLIDSKKNYDL